MINLDYQLSLLAEHVGGLESWNDSNTNNLYIRTTRDGVVHTISQRTIMYLSDRELLQFIINLLVARQIESSQEYVHTTQQSDIADRINEINAELDILRGRVPTPKEYTIDINRAKELMAELKELMK